MTHRRTPNGLCCPSSLEGMNNSLGHSSTCQPHAQVPTPVSLPVCLWPPGLIGCVSMCLVRLGVMNKPAHSAGTIYTTAKQIGMLYCYSQQTTTTKPQRLLAGLGQQHTPNVNTQRSMKTPLSLSAHQHKTALSQSLRPRCWQQAAWAWVRVAAAGQARGGAAGGVAAAAPAACRAVPLVLHPLQL